MLKQLFKRRQEPESIIPDEPLKDYELEARFDRICRSVEEERVAKSMNSLAKARKAWRTVFKSGRRRQCKS